MRETFFGGYTQHHYHNKQQQMLEYQINLTSDILALCA